jgi:hypothetical protein
MIAWFLRRLKRPVTIASLIAAIGLMVAGHYLDAHGGLAGLRSFTAYLERSLRSFDALHVGRVYLKELTGCEIVVESDRVAAACPPAAGASDALLRSRAGRSEPGVISGLILAVASTLARIWAEATWLGAAFHLLLLGGAAVWLARRLDVATAGPFSWLACLALTPLVASLSALGLKWFLLLLALLFSQTLAGIAWVLATFPVAIKWLGYGFTAYKTAGDIQAAAEDVSAAVPPRNPQGG